MKAIGAFALAVVAMAGATWFGGWWGVPVVAAVSGLLAGRDRAGRWGGAAALAGAVAWAILLVADSRGGGFDAATRTFGAIAGVPAAAFVALTVGFPAVLAGSAALIAAALSPRRGRSTRRRSYIPREHVLGPATRR